MEQDDKLDVFPVPLIPALLKCRQGNVVASPHAGRTFRQNEFNGQQEFVRSPSHRYPRGLLEEGG